MTAEQILKLVEAGYTKAEINNMISTGDPTPFVNVSSTTPEAEPATEQDPQPAGDVSEVKTTVKEPEETKTEPDPLEGIKAQIAELTNTLGAISKAVISPTLDNVKPLGAEDVIVKFFKEV